MQTLPVKTFCCSMKYSQHQYLNLVFLLVFPVARGSIKKVEQEEEHTTVTVELSRLYRQKVQVFVSGGVRVRSWTGRIKMPLQCGVRAGEGEFLFTGTVRFGEAWMSCAPRYKDFLRLYDEAQQHGTNPCHVDTDWACYLPTLRYKTSPHWVGRRAEPGDGLTQPPSSPAALWLCGDKDWSSWMLPSSSLDGLKSQNMMQRGMCSDCLYLADEELPGV